MAKKIKVCCDTCDNEVNVDSKSTILYGTKSYDLPEGWSFFDCDSLYQVIGEPRIEICDNCLFDLKKWFEETND